MQRRYGDTLIGRQELEGEIVEERMTGLWKRSYFAQSRLLARPELVRIVVAVDPPVTSTTGSDSCGIIVDRVGIRILRDPYSSKPYVLFYTTKRVGGGVQDFDAIKLLRFSA